MVESLFVTLLPLIVLAEEKHLRVVFGEQYVEFAVALDDISRGLRRSELPDPLDEHQIEALCIKLRVQKPPLVG